LLRFGVLPPPHADVQIIAAPQRHGRAAKKPKKAVMFDSISNALIAVREQLDWAPDLAVAVVIFALAAALAAGAHRLLYEVLQRFAGARRPYIRTILMTTRGITRLAFLVIAAFIALPAAPLEEGGRNIILRVLVLLTILLIGWAAVTAVNTAANIYLRRFRIDVEDNLLARKHVTQVRILIRALDSLLIVLTVGAALMTFESVRQYGVSLLASAGVAGLAAGLAARPMLSNLIAGVQLAVTQPIRIDDAVIIENESGSIEEITSTYVVVRLWDWRRLIVPLTYFIEKPFQNWTREGSELIGSVMLYLDYSAPIAQIRDKAAELAEQSKLWNKKVFAVQVTDAKENTIELRILVSANSAPATFDLRCEIREKLLDFLTREHPQALPRRRQEVIEAQPQQKSQPAARKYAT
jgi:small-conductance mechanosensitive channel